MMRAGFSILLLVVAVMTAASSKAAEPAFVGMEVQGMSATIARALGYDKNQGVLVKDVALDGPANRGGVKRGDLIVKFGGVEIDTFERLVMTVKSLSAGIDVPVTLLRRGEIHQVTVRTVPWTPAWKIEKGSFAAFPKIGVTVAALTPGIRQRFSLRWGSNGIVITLIDPDKSQGIDLARGQLIHQINQKPVWEPNQLTEMYREARKQGRKSLLLLVEDEKGFHFSILKVK